MNILFYVSMILFIIMDVWICATETRLWVAVIAATGAALCFAATLLRAFSDIVYPR